MNLAATKYMIDLRQRSYKHLAEMLLPLDNYRVGEDSEFKQKEALERAIAIVRCMEKVYVSFDDFLSELSQLLLGYSVVIARSEYLDYVITVKDFQGNFLIIANLQDAQIFYQIEGIKE